MMTRKKLLLIGGVVAVVLFVAYLVFSGQVGTRQEEAPTDSASVTGTSASVVKAAEDFPSLIETKTGVAESDGPTYVPTEEDVKEFIVPLVGWDTNTQTYEEWHEYTNSRVAYSEQDFPEEATVGITPSREQWDEGWRREAIASTAQLLGTYMGSGAVKIYDWNVSVFQTLYDPEGNPFIGAQNNVLVSIACGGPTMDDCFAYAYSGNWPIYFEEEVGTGLPGLNEEQVITEEDAASFELAQDLDVADS